ncbi:hypothetical protein AAMO2058_001608000 [Amorphochlora amoebiformis]
MGSETHESVTSPIVTGMEGTCTPDDGGFGKSAGSFVLDGVMDLVRDIWGAWEDLWDETKEFLRSFPGFWEDSLNGAMDLLWKVWGSWEDLGSKAIRVIGTVDMAAVQVGRHRLILGTVFVVVCFIWMFVKWCKRQRTVGVKVESFFNPNLMISKRLHAPQDAKHPLSLSALLKAQYKPYPRYSYKRQAQAQKEVKSYPIFKRRSGLSDQGRERQELWVRGSLPSGVGPAQIFLDWVHPEIGPPGSDVKQQTTTPIVAIFPSLVERSKAAMERLIQHTIKEMSWRCVVIYGRGEPVSIQGSIKSKEIFSPGYTGDIREALEEISKQYSRSPVLAVAYGLAANALIRYIGEDGDSCGIHAAVAIGCPFHISNDSIEDMSDAYSRLFNKVKLTNKGIRKDCLGDVIAKMWGYRTTGEFFRKSNSIDYLLDCKRPVLCVNGQQQQYLPKEETATTISTERGECTSWSAILTTTYLNTALKIVPPPESISQAHEKKLIKILKSAMGPKSTSKTDTTHSTTRRDMPGTSPLLSELLHHMGFDTEVPDGQACSKSDIKLGHNRSQQLGARSVLEFLEKAGGSLGPGQEEFAAKALKKYLESSPTN